MDVHFSSQSTEWQTPRHVYDLLNQEFHFNLDAAATKENALNDNFFDMEANSLVQDWSKYEAIYCNPPYGRLIGKFVEKAYNESLKGCIVAMLIPSRTDTRWWHNYCSKGEVLFIKGRLKFVNPNSDKLMPAPFPSAIVIFGSQPTTKYITI